MYYALGIAIGLVMIGGSPASAAPQWLQDYCFNKAERVRPALRQDEKEAYIANCIADHTPTPGSKRRKKGDSGY
ncbi:MAG TPA: hypothetical protein VNJ31_04955 [Methyloceanibacter sp.]|nr:hypothetical protein [Methyloceanibacter sp.]